MKSEKGAVPNCFGELDTVFPMGAEGLRQVPESCMHCCRYKVECLRTAMNDGHKGARAKEEVVDRAYESGRMGFFERWSRKKYLSQKGKKGENQGENE